MEKRKTRGRTAIIVGVLCVSAALALFLYNMWDDVRAGVQVTQEAEALIAAVLPTTTAEPSVQTPPPADPVAAMASAPATPVPTPAIEETPQETPTPLVYREMPVKTINGTEYVAILSIPILHLELPVRSEIDYVSMRYSPCRYVGSAYMDDLVICAHNYSQHFGRLRDLEKGNEVLLVDMDGTLFRYRVELIETLPPTAIREMIDSEYDLSLFTCTTINPRTRTTVRCRRIEE